MKLYCIAIKVENPEDENISDVIIDDFFANNLEQMEDRIYKIISDIKENGVKTIEHTIIPVNKVDGLNIDKLFNIINFDRA